MNSASVPGRRRSRHCRAKNEAEGPNLNALREKSDPGNINYAVTGEVDGNKLDEAGWGVIFGASVDQKIKEALQPLIDHRRSQAKPFFIYDGPTAPVPKDSARDWLRARKVRLDVVDPAKGVPFYLLLVPPPESIPFEFQYVLDIYWAVGRLWFDTPDEFRQYAEGVVVKPLAYGEGANSRSARQAPTVRP